MAARLEHSAPDFEARFERLVAARRASLDGLDEAVGAILAAVRERGDDALVEYAGRFDRSALTPGTLRVGAAEIARAAAAADPGKVAVLRRAAERIAAYHAGQMPEDVWYVDAEGVGLGARWTAIDAVGIYVPGGSAAYPSSVLMNAIPARTAGVGASRWRCRRPGARSTRWCWPRRTSPGSPRSTASAAPTRSPPSPTGPPPSPPSTRSSAPAAPTSPPPSAACSAPSASTWWPVLPRSWWSPTRPTIRRGSAADLLAQAEHDESAQSVLIADDAGFADAVAGEVEAQLAGCRAPRSPARAGGATAR